METKGSIVLPRVVEMNSLNEVIERINPSRCVFRKGYAFTSVYGPANIFDGIVIRIPTEAERKSPWKNYSDHSLAEHIAFINRHGLEKALIVTDDISFITQCPTLKYLEIRPLDTAADGFDFSPLYDMPEIRGLTCKTVYGPGERFCSTVDYSRVRGLRYVLARGKGHQNYHQAEDLERLWIQLDKSHKDFREISRSRNLKEVDLLQCAIRALDGIEEHQQLQSLGLTALRSLEDVSAVVHVRDTLRALSIQNCPRVTDFSWLPELTNLEYLSLLGKNQLPNLAFLNKMQKLKCFTFSMEVMSRDITPCLQVPYAWMEKGKKEYNLKDKDLPKGPLTNRFTLN